MTIPFVPDRSRGINQAEVAGALPSVAGSLVGFVVHAAVAGTAGYFVGKHTGAPVGTAIASALFGLPGMVVATYLAPKDGR